MWRSVLLVEKNVESKFAKSEMNDLVEGIGDDRLVKEIAVKPFRWKQFRWNRTRSCCGFQLM